MAALTTPFLTAAMLMLGLLSAAPTRAQSPGGADRPTAQAYRPPFEARTIDLPRSENGVDYRLYVRKPLREPREGESVVTVYLLDADWHFPAAATLLANREAMGHFPPLLFVGIGYPDDADGGREEHRTRDYTPTAFAPPDPAAHFLKPVDYEGSGGGPAFADVLQKQIIPYVEGQYRVDPTRRVIVGKSMGGLSAMQMLLTRPELFSDYLLVSPALWWDDYFKPFEARAINRLEVASHDKKLARPTRVYIAVGDGEERLGMLADVYVLGGALRLRNDPALELKIRMLDDEIHETIFPAGYSQGLQFLFRPRP